MSDSLPVSVERLLAHREWVRRISRALVDSRAEAADLEQEVWRAALANPPRVDRGLRSWFRVLLRRAAFDRWRSDAGRRRREARAARPEPTPATADLVARAETEGRLVHAALALDEPYRETVLLRYFSDLAPREIAARQGVPVETVRTRLRRALARLRSDLGAPPRGRGSRLALGVILMTAKTKVAVAAAVLLLAAGAVWLLSDHAAPAPPPAAAPEPVAALPAEIPDAPPLAAPRAVAHPEEPAPVESPAVALAPPSPPAPEPEPEPNVRVRVVDLAGRPVPAATVTLHPVLDRRRVPGTNRATTTLAAPAEAPAAFTARTGAAGAVSFAGVPPGLWRVLAAAADRADVRQSLRITGAHPEALTLVLAPAVQVWGTVRTSGGEPLAGVTVEVHRSSPLRDSAVTDERGGYRLADLPPGEIRLAVRTAPETVVGAGSIDVQRTTRHDIVLDLSVTVRGRVVDDETGRPVAGVGVFVDLHDSRRPGTYTQARAITSADGSWSIDGLPPLCLRSVQAWAESWLPYLENHDPGPTRLAAGAESEHEIRLRRGARLHGRVVLASGRPVADAELRFFPKEGEDAIGRSGEDGHYEFPSVAPGPARLRVIAAGLYQQGALPGYRTWEERSPNEVVTVPETGNVEKDVFMQRGGVIEGTARFADGSPCAGAYISIRPDGGGNATTDDAGAFRLEGVHPRDEIRVIVYGGPNGESGTSEPFAFPGDEPVTGVEVLAVRGAVVAGRVRFEGCEPPPSVDLRIGRRRVPVAADGSFRAEGLRAERHDLHLAAEGFGERIGPALELEPGEVREGMEIVLSPGLGIAGKVVLKGAGPARGVPIRIEPADPRHVFSRLGPVRAVTDDRGGFAIEDLSAGRWHVTADVPGTIRNSVEVAAGKTDLVIETERGLCIAGTVVDGDTGQPIAGVPVHIDPVLDGGPIPDERRVTRTDANGRFVHEPLYPAAFKVRFASLQDAREDDPPYVLFEHVIQAGAEGFRVPLQRGLTISGRVRGPGGGPLDRVSVTVRRSGAERGGTGEGVYGPEPFAYHRVSTEPDGTFVIPRVPPGTYTVAADDRFRRGFLPARVSDVAAGATGVELVLGRGLTIAGRVVGPDGGPPMGRGHVRCGTKGTRRARVSVRVAEDGTFRTEPLNGRLSYDLWADDWPDTLGGRVVDVAPGTEDVVIRLERGGVITGRVVDEAGDPVPAGVRVVGYADRPPRGETRGTGSSTETHEDGRFVLAGLGPWRFRLRAVGDGWETFGWKKGALVRPGATGVELTVGRFVSFSARIVDADGTPIRTKLRYLQPRDGGRTGGDARSDAEGRFSIPTLVPGPFHLWARVRGIERDLGEHTAPAEGVTIPAR